MACGEFPAQFLFKGGRAVDLETALCCNDLKGGGGGEAGSPSETLEELFEVEGRLEPGVSGRPLSLQGKNTAATLGEDYPGDARGKTVTEDNDLVMV
jgi:hypothetical protein